MTRIWANLLKTDEFAQTATHQHSWLTLIYQSVQTDAATHTHILSMQQYALSASPIVVATNFSAHPSYGSVKKNPKVTYTPWRRTQLTFNEQHHQAFAGRLEAATVINGQTSTYVQYFAYNSCNGNNNNCNVNKYNKVNLKCWQQAEIIFSE